MKANTTLAVRFLKEGEEFIIPSLKNNEGIPSRLILLRSGDCSSLVLWGNSREHIANSTQVQSSGIVHDVQKNSSGLPQLINNNSYAEKTIKIIRRGNCCNSRLAPEKRERMTSHKIEWPREEFTIKDLSKKINIPYHTIANALNKNRNNFIKTKEAPNGSGRGKPISWWKIKV